MRGLCHRESKVGAKITVNGSQDINAERRLVPGQPNRNWGGRGTRAEVQTEPAVGLFRNKVIRERGGGGKRGGGGDEGDFEGRRRQDNMPMLTRN